MVPVSPRGRLSPTVLTSFVGETIKLQYTRVSSSGHLRRAHPLHDHRAPAPMASGRPVPSEDLVPTHMYARSALRSTSRTIPPTRTGLQNGSDDRRTLEGAPTSPRTLRPHSSSDRPNLLEYRQSQRPRCRPTEDGYRNSTNSRRTYNLRLSIGYFKCTTSKLGVTTTYTSTPEVLLLIPIYYDISISGLSYSVHGHILLLCDHYRERETRVGLLSVLCPSSVVDSRSLSPEWSWLGRPWD